MLKNCPDSIDVQDLQFKLQCRLKIFDNIDLNTFQSPNLLSCASRYGLLFVGSNSSSLQVIQTKCIENYSPKDKDVSNYPRRLISLPSSPRHICVNCDSTILAVVIEKDNCPIVVFYDVLSFLKQNVTVLKEARLSSTPGVYVTETNWNPALPPIFTACKSDGTLCVFELKDNSISINELPPAAEATSFCWSPKGKQIAVGSRNGKITQYKPDLKAVKAIGEPPLQGAHVLLSLQWVSNYQFIGVYQSGGPEGSAKLIVVDAPKTGEVAYTNYEDICYSGNSRPPQFYTILQQHWNILIVASANSTELGVLANSGDVWTQWILPDTARAELPLSSDHQETFPVGLGLDISSTAPLPWNETSIPPCPYLLVLSHQGVLCIFNIVNLKEGVPSICTPPDPVSDTGGVTQFVTTPQIPVMTEPKVPAFSFSPAQVISAPQSLPVAPMVLTQHQSLPVAPMVLTQHQSSPVAPMALTQHQSSPVAPMLLTQHQSSPVAPMALTQHQSLPVASMVLTQPQPTYTAPGSLFGAQTNEPKPLFGGQAVITSISSQQPVSQASLFGGQTLVTPVNKPVETAVGGRDKYASIFGAVNTPTSAPVSIPTKPIVISLPAVTKSEQEVVQARPIAPPAEPKAINLKVKGEKDALLAQMVREECVSLENELRELVRQGKSPKLDVGTEDEKLDLVLKIEELQEFVKEIVDISIGENAEVHYLKQNLIQCWAWFEEARSRYNASKDESLLLLLRSQPLDSATEKRQQDMTKLMYYIETQIGQASKALDEQWDNFQDYAKKTYRTKMPTMETIFQTMVRQNVVLQKQSYILKDIANRLKSKSSINKGPPLLLSLENTDDLDESLKHLQLDHPQDIYQLQYERVLKRMKNLSISKTNKLRNLLKTREVQHVTVVKPQLSSSIVLQSPESKSKQLLSNLLAMSTQVSPVSKLGALPRQLNFVHSTPIREPSIDVKPTDTPPNTPQVDAKTFTFKKVERSSSAAAISGFANPVKSGPAFGQHSPSAFAPTTQVGANKPFSFAPAAKTDSESAAPTFSFSTSTPALSKFVIAPPLKTTSATTTTSSPIVTTTLPQFSFGSSITLTPITVPKKPDSTTATAKPAFSLGGTGSKVNSPTTSETTVFSSLSQPGTPLFGGTSAAPGTFSFGGASGTSKVSAFTAVTTSLPSAGTFATNPEGSTMAGQPFATVSTPNMTTTKPMFGAGTTTKARSIFGASTTPSLTTTASPVITGSTSLFGNLTLAAPVSSSIPATGDTSSSTPSATTTAPSLFSLPPKSDSTAEETSKTTNSGMFFGTAPLSVGSSTQSTSIFGATTISTRTAKSLFGTSPSSPKTTQAPIFGTSGTTTQPSIFGGTTSGTTEPSIFGGPSSMTTSGTSTLPIFGGVPSTTTSGTTVSSTTQPIFGGVPSTTTSGTTSSIFGGASSMATSGSIFGGTASTRPSIFSAPTSAQATSGSIFGTAESTTTQPSLFKSTGPATTGSIFDSPTAATAPLFGTPATTTTPIFGATIASAPPVYETVATTTSAPTFGTTQASIFTTTTQASIFGTSAPSTTTTSIFGGTTTTQSSVFETPISSATTKPSIFGTTQPSVFDPTAPATTQQASIFGGTTNTSQPSIFGTAVTQPSVFATANPSVFGATYTAPVSQPSVFATASVPSTQPALFAASTAASAFGSGAAASVAPFGQSGSIFGTPKTNESPFGSTFGSPGAFGSTPATTTSAFGQPAPFGSGSPGVFGAPTTTTSVFGAPAAGSTFGATSSAANAFGSPAPSSSFSFAGTTSNAGAPGSFGFGNLSVGSTATTTGSIFGGGTAFGTPPANPFGKATEQKPAFGGTGNIFSTPASTSSSVFGSGSGSVFGATPQGGFGTSTFGSPAFGQQSTFGQNSFGNASFGNTSGPFSGGGAAVGQAGFGSPTSFQKPSGFGSSPVFGGSPAFGSAPSFGGAPAFGATPSFGSPNKVFGSNTAAGFGSAPTGGAGFGNLAGQNTVGFGSLAQQAASSNATPFSGSSSSFSSWR